jgi:molybdopterin molybdotransferase
MMDVETALDVMLSHATATPKSENVALFQAHHRILARDVVAPRDQPPFAASAMDGHACASTDLPGQLRLIGQAAAGSPFMGVLPPKSCVRISTGAPVPEGADCVVKQEDAQVSGDIVSLKRAISGANIRKRGNDYSAADVLLQSGRKLTSLDIALAAATGADHLSVARQPTVIIISGGDEIIAAGTVPTDAQIFDSVGPSLSAFVEMWGGVIVKRILVRDDPVTLTRALETAAGECDLVVIVGGASVGPHDHGKAGLEAIGAQIFVPKIAIKPGKPTWFAIAPNLIILGLPGNPASALVCARLFLAPLLQSLLGRPNSSALRTTRAILRDAVPATGARQEAFRMAFDPSSGITNMLGDQDSSLVSVLSKSDGLFVQMANQDQVQAGTSIQLLLWDR